MLTWVLRLHLSFNCLFLFYVCYGIIVCKYLLLLFTSSTTGCNGNSKCNDHQQSQPMHYQLCYARVVKDVLVWKWNSQSLPTRLPTGNLVQRSVEKVSLKWTPLDFVCEAVEFFGHVKELECRDITDPQQVCLCIVWQPHEHSSVCRNCSLAENR